MEDGRSFEVGRDCANWNPPVYEGYDSGGRSTKRGIGQYDEFHEMNFSDFIRKYGLEQKTVIDVGCGNGVFLSELLERFPGMRVIGVDIKLYRHGISNFRVNDARSMVDIETGIADMLVSTALTQWVKKDPQRLYAEAYRVLSEDGKGFIFPCNPEHVPHHVLKYSFLRKLQKGPLQVNQLIIWKRSIC